MKFNDDEIPIVATQTQDDVSSGDKGSSSRTDRIKVKIINKSEAPLEETKFKVMLELMGNEFGNERPGLDLVTVLDLSRSMKGERLEKMKIAMQLVIKKLRPIDCLSVITFCERANRLCPLRQMTENSQAEIEKLVNNLVASGNTNISAGLEMGLQVLNNRRLIRGRVVSIMLLSDGPQDHQYKDAAKVRVDSVPVYTFGLGEYYDLMVLNAIAENSCGGTFTDVQNENNLCEALSQCLDGFLTVAVQDLKVTVTQQNSTIENVSAENYPQSNDAGSITIFLGDLHEKEKSKVIVDLLLPAVSSAYDGMDVLQISYTYSVGGKVIYCRPIIAVVNRIWISQELDREELKIEEIRLATAMKIKEAIIMADNKQLENAKDVIVEAQYRLDDEVDVPLKSELQQLLNLMETQDIYDNLGHGFALSCEASNDQQRFAEKGPSSRTKVRIINKMEAPLAETGFEVMLEITGNASGNQSLGLDLVTVLDVSGSMEGLKLEKMKITMQLVIKKLRPIDRLSVVTFSGDSKTLCPLCHINEYSRAGIENLVNYLAAQDQGPGDIGAGLEMGLKVLNGRMYTSERVVAIMLLSDGGQNQKFPNASEVQVGNVPIFTFGLGTDMKLLKSIADNSSGGTFKNVQNLDNLTEAFSQCLDRLFTVEVQDLKVTFKKINSAIKNVYAGNYPQFRKDDVGSVTVSFGNLYKKEPHQIKVDLLLPDVHITHFGRKLIHTNPRIVNITRRNSAPMINEARVVSDKQVEIAKKMIIEAQKLLQNVVDETLNSEVQQLKRLMNSQKLYNDQETDEVTIDEFHLLTADSGVGTIRSLEASIVHSNNDLKKFPIEFLLDRTVVRERIPQPLNRINNYVDWSEKVKKDLEELNLLKVIKEAPIETTESIENINMCTAIKKLRQFRENWMALILINHACGFPINLQIIDLHSARTAWDTLATTWEQENLNYLWSRGPNVESFLSAGKCGDSKTIEHLLDSIDSKRELAKARIPSSQNTVLHLASLSGEVNIVKKLVRFMTEEDLEIQDKDGCTALANASINGNKRIAQCMVEKNRRLVSIPTGTKLLPVVIAMMYGKKEMASYLYNVTPKEDLTNKSNSNGAMLLTYSIKMQHYGLEVIDWINNNRVSDPHEDVSQSVPDEDVSKSNWDIKDTRLSIQDEDVSQSNQWNTGYRGIWRKIVSHLLAVLGIKRIYEMKLVHRQSSKLLGSICRQIKDDLDDVEINGIINALHEAAAKGVVELISKVLETHPEFGRFRDKQRSTIFMKAVEFRQERVFSFLQGFACKDIMMGWVDDRGENILHKLKYNSADKITSIRGAVLKMQEELQWREEIESMMSPDSLDEKNYKGKTPRQLFRKSHKKLMIDAENCMHNTANSCIIVGVLAVTLTFAAAFTVPGGIDQNTGFPLFLRKKMFKVFIISDAVSLFSSTTSVLIFTGMILSSRYAKKDFTMSFCRQMLSGLFFLLLSMATTVLTFTATLFMMLHAESQIILPAIISSLAVFPILLYVGFLYPLALELTMSTYGPSIFNRKSKWRFFSLFQNEKFKWLLTGK